ncbi:hypothetical protein P22_1474 [Propionispora sp. 2/2-37]|uniref:class II fructose-bisphosphate aldolase n=1 Tax=Propionispora sp. 2/2-37 TaxID=1677858 RepID=UPI0006BB8850|nr:ketose-bisphosphate aldolase [Propionispora sp. 2/2-37]CUH95404.1 hypothetical protein P22_1474 [Propionispora sp. 2/2-37]
MIVSAYRLLFDSNKAGQVLGAFNTHNLEVTKAIIEGAEETGYPALVQISPGSVELSGYETISAIFHSLAKKAAVPLALHLDHGRSFEEVKRAVEAGFHSIMIDGSQLSYEDNVELTRKVVSYCHERDIPVEAELGVISGKEDDLQVEEHGYTDPRVAADFCEKTNCDLLAVSIGNVHGLRKDVAINLQILQELKTLTATPLVIHGGSGISQEIVRQFKEYGVRKVNFSSELKNALIRSVGERYIANPGEYDIVSVTKAEVRAIKQVVMDKLLILN